MRSRGVVLVSVFASLAVSTVPGDASGGDAPDLTAAAVKFSPASVGAGEPFTVAAKVKNVAEADAKKSRASAYLSADKKKDSADISIGIFKAPALEEASAAKINGEALVPGDFAPGDYRVIICADGADKIEELNEKNNCRAAKTSLRVNRVAPQPEPAPVPDPAPGPTAAALTISPTDANFGNATVGGDPAGRTFTVRNTGEASSGPISTSIAGIVDGDFSVPAAGDTCAGASLAGGATCSFDVSFSPASNGAKSASLSAQATPGGVASSSLSGVGIPPQQIVHNPNSISLTEGGTANIEVHLAAPPPSDVEVAVISSDVGAAFLSTGSLTFTPANYATDQTIVLTGAQDLDTIPEILAIRFNSPGLPKPADIDVSVADDDVQAFVTSAESLTIDEGTAGLIQVRLAFAPAGQVMASVGSSDAGVATVNPSDLFFSQTTYTTDQTVTVTGVADGDTSDEAATVSMSIQDPPTTKSIPVTVLDTSPLNETDASEEADFCAIQFPATTSAPAGRPLDPIYGRIFEIRVTEPSGASEAISAEIGIGPAGSDPRTSGGWTFSAAEFSGQVGEEDEYRAQPTAPGAPGTYSYVYRFSLDGGHNHTYCDLSGAGSGSGQAFDPANLGTLTVVP